ncbi:DUF3592 domain-containing protein [Catenuloplanes japonicus]|uniref:DUF3592 domain-containing protein n=1 Tax=Catenuloplanes japonicus TaxID=33876 RepID=UPI000524ED55|nr:DUF3592 domain-containing protein [Catenuloplanes japonicus]
MEAILTVLALFAGVLGISAGVREVRRQRTLARDGVQVTGHVYRVDVERDSDGATYRPLIAYRDENGVEQKFRSSLSGGRERHPVGSEVPLRYVPGRPGLVDIDTTHNKAFSLLLTFGIGVVFLSVAVYAVASGEVL